MEQSRAAQATAVAERARAEWSAAFELIQDAVHSLVQKMSEIQLKLSAIARGASGSALAVAQIIGEQSGKGIELVLNLHADGTIHAFSQGPKMVSSKSLSIFSAKTED